MTLAFESSRVASSPLAKFDPRWKLAAIGFAILAVAFLRDSRTSAIALTATLIMLAFARLPGRLLLTRLAAFALFLIPFLVILPLMRGWNEGLRVALFVALRAATLFGLALVLVAASPFHELLRAAQALGLPRVLTQIASMSHRYLYVMRDEFYRIRTALRVRGFRSGTNLRTFRTVGYVAGSLIVRGEERAQRVAAAMRCRGFDGRFRSLSPFATRTRDVAFFIMVISAATGILIGDLILRS